MSGHRRRSNLRREVGHQNGPVNGGRQEKRAMYDAIVVGARVAGSSTAMLLARKGYRVLLVDKATFPSDTMSTHALKVPAVAQLKRWGLLEYVVASNCPPITNITFDVG